MSTPSKANVSFMLQGKGYWGTHYRRDITKLRQFWNWEFSPERINTNTLRFHNESGLRGEWEFDKLSIARWILNVVDDYNEERTLSENRPNAEVDVDLESDVQVHEEDDPKAQDEDDPNSKNRRE